jgi:type III pantothenate kinase
MSIQLAIDRGNSFTKISVFNGVSIVAFEACLDDQLMSVFRSWMKAHQPGSIIVSDVRGDFPIREFEEEAGISIIPLSLSLTFPFTIHYETPETIGQDRLANIAGATRLRPNSNVLIIDCGTCITYSLLFNGSFIGGSIAPGVRMRYRALHEFTGQLPLIEPSAIRPITAGRSTAGSIQSGVELASLLETDAMIAAYRKEFNDLHVIITGGDYSFFENSLKSTIFAVPQLTQLGLHELLRINHC